MHAVLIMLVDNSDVGSHPSEHITWIFLDQKLMLLFNAMMFLDFVKESSYI